MATKTLNLLCLSSAVFFIKSVAAYYCNNDKCLEGEYCCGNNICCASYTVWELWYFWFGIVVFLILLCMCICLWKSRYRDRRILMAYGLMSTKQQKANIGSRFTDTVQDIEGKKSLGKYHHLQQDVPPSDVIDEYKGPHDK